MRWRSAIAVVAGVLALLASTSAQAQVAKAKAKAQKAAYVAVPKINGKRTGLVLRLASYKGGHVTAEVFNRTKVVRHFDPNGLFFIPQTKPEHAPQRMGAAGPYAVLVKGKYVKKTGALAIRPKQKVSVRLEVFCLDSHRGSPSDGQAFRVAKKRLPKKMRRAINAGVRAIHAHAFTQPAPAAVMRSNVQSHVWTVRNKTWVRLEGERKREKLKRRLTPRPSRRTLRRTPRQAP